MFSLLTTILELTIIPHYPLLLITLDPHRLLKPTISPVLGPLLKIDDLNHLRQIEVELDRLHYKLQHSNNQTHNPSKLSQKHTISVQLPFMDLHFIIKKKVHPSQDLLLHLSVVLPVTRYFLHIRIATIIVPVGLQIQFIVLLTLLIEIQKSPSFVVNLVLCYVNITVSIVVQAHWKLLEMLELYFDRFLVYLWFQVHLFMHEINIEHYFFKKLLDLAISSTITTRLSTTTKTFDDQYFERLSIVFRIVRIGNKHLIFKKLSIRT